MSKVIDKNTLRLKAYVVKSYSNKCSNMKLLNFTLTY